MKHCEDTMTFHCYNANPKNRKASDCVARAICVALEETWESVIREMTELGIKHGYVFNEKKTIEKYLAQKGWVMHKQPRKFDGTKYTGDEFCKRIANSGTRYVANIGGHHIVAIVNRKVIDTWDSTKGSIGNYWTKGE